MKYYFEMGTNCAITLAELRAVLGLACAFEIVSEKIVVVDIKEKIVPENLIRRLGGVIKIGEVLGITKRFDVASLEVYLEKFTEEKKKIFFGISYYGKSRARIKELGMALKKYFNEKEISCRYVSGKSDILSSVIVEQNKLIEKGFELCIIETKDYYLIGRTLAVQPFKELSSRDFGRPARDDESGMLPPKLAQILLNLAVQERAGALRILDPFCGSGTVISEARLMGYQEIFGTDISEKAIMDSRKNFDWTMKKAAQAAGQPLPDNDEARKIFQVADATRLSQNFAAEFFDAIATEPYLGPQRGLIDHERVAKDLSAMYARALFEFKKILHNNGRIVMLFPVFNHQRGQKLLQVDLSGYRVINPLASFGRNPLFRLSPRGNLLYGRAGQKVWREIIILEKE